MESTTPPLPNEQPGPSREGFLLGAAVLLGAVVFLGALWFLGARSDGVESIGEQASTENEADQAPGSNDDELDQDAADEAAGDVGQPDSDESTAAGQDEPESSADDSVQVETVACPEGTQSEICEAVEFVQQARQRPFKQFPAVELLADAEFDRELLALVEEDEDEIRAEGRIFKSLGLIDTDLDLYQTYLDLLEIGVVGFYEPESERMVVRGEEFNLYGQLVLVHELAHAFDDQWHDLSRDDFADLDAEYSFSAVVEGNASRVEDAWRDSLSADDQARLASQELSALSPDDFARMMALPPVILELQISPYVDGKAFMQEKTRAGGEAAANDLLDTPPATSEHILHPGAEADVLAREDLPAVQASGQDLGDGQLGEFLIGLWLGERAAAGWGDDSYRVSEQGGTTCTTVTVSADTDTDLDELEQALESWADEADGRQVERVEIEVASGTVRALNAEGCYR